MWIWKNWYVSECPDNISLYHNASSYSTPSPLYNVGLFFNGTTAVRFECIYETIYYPTTKFTWTVSYDGARVHTSEGSRYLEYYFANAGEYVVMCYAGYVISNCPSCNKTTSVPITIDGTFNFVWLLNIIEIDTLRQQLGERVTAVSNIMQGFIQAPFGGGKFPPNLATSPPRIFGQLWFPRQLFVLTF